MCARVTSIYEHKTKFEISTQSCADQLNGIIRSVDELLNELLDELFTCSTDPLARPVNNSSLPGGPPTTFKYVTGASSTHSRTYTEQLSMRIRMQELQAKRSTLITYCRTNCKRVCTTSYCDLRYCCCCCCS